jgi:FkbM family methyltransferase
MVGPEGKVIALEPLPPCVEAIRRNASLNGMNQIKVHEGALFSHTGKIGFQSDSDRSAGWIAKQPAQAAFEAPCWTLDDFLPSVGITKADVIKLDAGGNELAVLRGGAKSLGNGNVGVLAMKLYHPSVTKERFGYDSRENLRLLIEWGFQLKLMVQMELFPIRRVEDVDAHFDSLNYSHLVVATKC